MKEAEELVDITLVFGERRVLCHRVILAGTCDQFHRMFLANMVESASDEVTMEGISASIGVLLVEYLYGGDVEITSQNAQDLLEASEMLMLGTLKQNVEEFLCGQTDSANCISLLNLAQMYDLHSLLEDAREYLHNHVKEVLHSEEINLLREGDLVKVLTANDSPEDNFRLMQKWVKSDESRTGDFVKFIHHVQLSQCYKEFLHNTVMVEELMFNKQCMELLRQAIDTHPPEQQSLAKPPNQNMQYSACAYPGGFIMSGGWSHNSVPQPDCCSFNVQNDQWVILPPMSTAREWHSSIYHKDHLYVVGGRGDTNKYLDTVESLDIKSLQWSHLPCLPQKCEGGAAVSFDDHVYVVGG
ncbi:hypothetical protein CAPTEDRAFT_34910, partial [Capitella teleta]